MTISDVASRAQVSTATVSRALARPDSVSDVAREKVMQAVRETGYTPNVAARTLRRARSMMVLAIVPSYVTPFFSELLVWIDRALAAKGYGLVVGDLIDREEQVPRLVALAASGQVDGVILLNGEVLQDGGRRADELGVPHVALNVPADGNIPAVLADDRGGGAAVARHLVSLGHQRFAYISGPAGNHCDTHRWAGFREGLAEAGIPSSAITRIEARFNAPSGAQAGEAFLTAEPRPTGVFCASDVNAMGFIHTLHGAGLRVPQDVSVAGFDGIALGQFYAPDLTTVVQPPDLLGRAAAERLIATFEQTPGLDQTVPDIVPVTLRVGASTAAPPRPGHH